MVKAILDGRKTQTRRFAKGVELRRSEAIDGPKDLEFKVPCFVDKWGWCPVEHNLHLNPYGAPGDRLWVRETWARLKCSESEEPCLDCQNCRDGRVFRADDPEREIRWKPSIYMPRWASRLTLEIVSVRVERLQDISEEDAKAEGVSDTHTQENRLGMRIETAHPASENFAKLWESINGPDSWTANPWVWVIEFRKIAGGKA